jgi:hypothetical protein
MPREQPEVSNHYLIYAENSPRFHNPRKFFAIGSKAADSLAQPGAARRLKDVSEPGREQMCAARRENSVMYQLLSHPFWGRKVRFAVFTLATFIALC